MVENSVAMWCIAVEVVAASQLDDVAGTGVMEETVVRVLGEGALEAVMMVCCL